MKTTLEIQDELFARAKRLSKRTGRPLRALVEEGLRHVLSRESAERYQLPDRSVGAAGDENPLEAMPWSELLREIYGRDRAP